MRDNTTTDQEKQDRTRTAEPLAAGRYWVGDPCYAFNEDPDGTLWSEWLNDAWSGVDANRVRILDGRVRGARVAASGTAYGDGWYQDQFGNSYGVDAGLLGAVHEDHFFVDAKKAAELMVLVEFHEPFHVEFNEETGTVKIGPIEIETGDAGDDEDDDEDDIFEG